MAVSPRFCFSRDRLLWNRVSTVVEKRLMYNFLSTKLLEKPRVVRLAILHDTVVQDVYPYANQFDQRRRGLFGSGECGPDYETQARPALLIIITFFSHSLSSCTRGVRGTVA